MDPRMSPHFTHVAAESSFDVKQRWQTQRFTSSGYVRVVAKSLARQAEGPSEEGPSSAAGFANRKGIFHERFPVLPLPKPTHGLAISSESLCEQPRKDTRRVGFGSMVGG